MRFSILSFFALTAIILASCVSGKATVKPVVIIDPENPYLCRGYQEADNSKYILPYGSGRKYLLVQGNCTRYSHYGLNRYAYDFGLPMKTEILAVRDGVVLSAEMIHPDNSRRYEKRRYKRTGKPRGNCILIQHRDGTVAVYYHLMQNSSSVKKGDHVKQGEVIARSGNSGFTTGPHLHFEVRRSKTDRQTIPVTFKNAAPGEQYNLKTGNKYLALKPSEMMKEKKSSSFLSGKFPFQL